MSLELMNNAEYHNHPRGVFLGTYVTDKQWEEIKNGTFDDLYVGDYWIINDVKWRIAHLDYEYNNGDAQCTTHHAIIVPDTILVFAKMNATNIVTGGYIGCDFRTGNNDNDTMESIVKLIEDSFGSEHILTFRTLLTNAASSAASGWAWTDSKVDLMSETMVSGHENVGQSYYEVGADKTILALFSFCPWLIKSEGWYWLRNVQSSTAFAAVNENGLLDNADPTTLTAHGSSEEGGIRPYFAICG